MTIKEQKFVELVFGGMNSYQAAVNAGYAPSTAEHANEWIKQNPKKPDKYKPELAKYLTELVEKAQDERIMSAKERQAVLSDISRNAAFDADRIRAIDTLNKMTGEYTVKVTAEVNTSPKLADVMDQIGGEGLEE